MNTYKGSKHFTLEEIAIAEENGIDFDNMKQRKRLGWTNEDIITRPVARKGIGVKKGTKFKAVESQFFTQEEQKQAFENGILYTHMINRLRQGGWTTEEIITTPIGGTRNRMQEKELREVVGRIKYMQNSDMDYPPPITVSMQKRLDEYGIDIGQVEEVYVDLSDIPKEEAPEIPGTSLELAY